MAVLVVAGLRQPVERLRAGVFLIARADVAPGPFHLVGAAGVLTTAAARPAHQLVGRANGTGRDALIARQRLDTARRIELADRMGLLNIRVHERKRAQKSAETVGYPGSRRGRRTAGAPREQYGLRRMGVTQLRPNLRGLLEGRCQGPKVEAKGREGVIGRPVVFDIHVSPAHLVREGLQDRLVLLGELFADQFQ